MKEWLTARLDWLDQASFQIRATDRAAQDAALFFPGHPGCGLLPVELLPSRCAGCDMPGAFRAGNPLRQGTCSGVSYAKKTIFAWTQTLPL